MGEKKHRKIGKYTIFYDNFKGGFQPNTPNSPYAYFSGGPALPLANDAAGGVTVSPFNLSIKSTPFTYTNPSGLDHVKYLVYQKTPYEAPTCGEEIVYEGVISVQQTNMNPVPERLRALVGSVIGVNDVFSDVRLAAAGFNTLDASTMIVADFFIGSRKVYALYERLPFLMKAWGGPLPNYDAFTHVIPVATRSVATADTDYIKLAIAYNYYKNTITWRVNDVDVFKVNRIGYPIENKYRIIQHSTPGQIEYPPSLIRPTSFQYGFGTFSLMDATNPYNHAGVNNPGLVDLSLNGTLPTINPIDVNVDGTSQEPNFLLTYPEINAITQGHGTNYGQGCIINLQYVTVYITSEEGCLCKLSCDKGHLALTRCFQNDIAGVNSTSDIVIYKCKGCLKDNCNCSNSKKCYPLNHPNTIVAPQINVVFQ